MKGQLSLSLFVPQLCLRFGGGMENPVTDMGFVWECDGNSIEEKNVLEDSLPEGFKYKMNKSKLLKSRKSRRR